jgi:hypothetical protein
MAIAKHCISHAHKRLPSCQSGLRREVEEIESQISNAGHTASSLPVGNTTASGTGSAAGGGKAGGTAKSLVKLKAEKLERQRALRLAQQVWCGVVWCGVVWCGVVWCGVVWCGVVWCGVVWCIQANHQERA